MVKKLRDYLKSHFAVSFVLTFAVMVLMIVLIFQGYLKRKYIQYLTEQNYATENAVMEPVQKNVHLSIQELINLGARLVTEEELYQLTDQAAKFDGDEKIIAKNHLYTQLCGIDYPKNITAAVVVGPDEVLVQYDRYRNTFYNSLWSGENAQVAVDKTRQLHSSIRAGSSTRYTVLTELPVAQGNVHSRTFHIVLPLVGKNQSVLSTEYALILSCRMETFQEFLNAVEIPKTEYIQGYLADQDGKIIYHKDESLIGQDENILLAGKNQSVITKDVGFFGWDMNIIIDESEMKAQITQIYNDSVVLYVALIMLCVIAMSAVTHYQFRPLKQIAGALKEVERGNYHMPIEIRGQHEMWQMAEEYNKMIAAIDSQNHEIQRQYQENLLAVKRQQQAERETLESQINAHFICNTLGSITYGAIEAGDHHVSVLLKKLSNILRYTFDQKSQNVCMYQEIGWIDQYLYLQKYRYESFDYEIHFPDIYNYWPCCKLLFQPFVENSILHGFEGRAEGGMVRILAEGAGERLKICIQDNGCGMDDQTADIICKILRHKGKNSRDTKDKVGIGIHNVVTRMYMYYGENLDIQMETEQGKGTRFTFWIPVPEKNTD